MYFKIETKTNKIKSNQTKQKLSLQFDDFFYINKINPFRMTSLAIVKILMVM